MAQSTRGAEARANAPLSETLEGTARADFNASQILLKGGDYAGAYSKLEHAYDLSNEARLLFNMAICARELHDYARMQRLLVHYRRERMAIATADERAQVDAALTAIRERVGAIDVKVGETAATVAADGETVGATPLEDRVALNPGKHTLTVTKAGFQPWEQTVHAAAGAATELTVRLIPERESHARQVQRLIVVSDEAATVVVDDGKGVAVGRFDGALEPGAHALRVTEPGKVAYKVQIDLKEGETRRISVTLANERAAAPVWPWIAGGAALATGLALGGYFVFRPQGESPSPPVGTLGVVHLAWRSR
jgi:PEGA domain